MQASDLQKLNVAVIGAGYAGAAAGKALSLLGCNVAVYEQARQIREVGAGIGLRPSTMDRFRQWGILDAITKVSSPSDFFQGPNGHRRADHAGALGRRSRPTASPHTSFTAATSSTRCSECCPLTWCVSATRPRR